MKTIKMKLHSNWEYWSGHCQITYTTRNEEGQRLVYCLQDNGAKFGGIRLLRCTQDGEPSHEVSFSKVRVKFEKPQGDSRLESVVRAWIEQHDRSQSHEDL